MSGDRTGRGLLIRDLFSRFFAGVGYGAALGIFALVPWTPEWASSSSVPQLAVVGVSLAVITLFAIFAALAGPTRYLIYELVVSIPSCLGAALALVTISNLLDWPSGWMTVGVSIWVCIIAALLARSSVGQFVGFACLAGAAIYIVSSSLLTAALGVLLAFLVLSGFAYLSRVGSERGVGLAGTLLVFATVVAATAAFVLAASTSSGAQKLATSKILVEADGHQLFDGRNYSDGKPALFNPTSLAVSADGERIAVFDYTGVRTGDIWIFTDGQARLAASSVGLTAPTYTSAQLYEYGDGDLAQGMSNAFSGNDGAVLDSTFGPARAPTASAIGTRSLAFEGDTLYGVTPTGLWRLADGGGLETVKSWPEFRDRQVTSVEPGLLMVTSTDSDGLRSQVELIDVSDGEPSSSAVQFTDADGVDLQDKHRREGQAGYVISGDGTGSVTALVGSRLFTWSKGGEIRELGLLPLQGRPSVDEISAKGSALAVVESNGVSYTVDDIVADRSISRSRHFGNNDALEECREAGLQSRLPFGGQVATAFAADADVVVSLRRPNNNCTTELWQSGITTPNWRALNHVAPKRQESSYTGRLVVGAISSLNADVSAFSSAAMNEVLTVDGSGAFRPSPAPARQFIDSPLIAPVRADDREWLGGRFVSKDAKEDYSGLVYASPDGNVWTKAKEIRAITDLTVANSEIYLSTCTGIMKYGPAARELDEVMHVHGQPEDCAVRHDPGPTSAWGNTLGTPFAIAADPDRRRLLVGEMKSTPTGSTVIVRIAQIDLPTGKLSPLRGGDLSDLGVVPVDVNVSRSGRVCATTAVAGSAGPLVIVESDGARKIVRLRGSFAQSRLLTCAWKGDELVAGTADGQLVRVEI